MIRGGNDMKNRLCAGLALLAFMLIVSEAAAWAAVVEVRAASLNDSKFPAYNSGDTIHVTGTEQLNSVGWSTLNSSTKDSARKNFGLVLDNGQTSVPADAMRYNGYLTSFNASAVKTIGSAAFMTCPLTSAFLPRAETIGDESFAGCDKLASVYLPVAKEIGRRAFSVCTKLTGVSLPEAVKIGDFAFNGSSQLKNVSLPLATELGVRSFYGSALTRVSLPKVRTIGSESFAVCTQLVSASLPTVEAIQSKAFEGCSALKEIHLDNADPSTGKDAFRGVPRGLLIYADREKLKGTDYPEGYRLVHPVSHKSSSHHSSGCDTVIFVSLPFLAALMIITMKKRVRGSTHYPKR
jgi:hypothetical protein